MSVVVRLRRTIVEEIHVSVPITDAVVTDDHLDGAKIFAAAVVLGQTAPQPWRRDGDARVEVHPMQTPPPELVGTPRTIV
jgi:hypothetical protein